MGDHCHVSTNTNDGMARLDCATHSERGKPTLSRK